MNATEVPYASPHAIRLVFPKFDTDALPLDIFHMIEEVVKKHKLKKETLKSWDIPENNGELNRDKGGRFVHTLRLTGTNYFLYVFHNRLGWDSTMDWSYEPDGA